MAAEVTLTKVVRPLVVGLRRLAPTLNQIAQPYVPPRLQERRPLNFEARPLPSSQRLSGIFNAYSQPQVPSFPQATFRSFDLPGANPPNRQVLSAGAALHAAATEEDEVALLDGDAELEEETVDIESDGDSARGTMTPTSTHDEEELVFLEPPATFEEAPSPLEAELRSTQRFLDAREEELGQATAENASLQAENRALLGHVERQEAQIKDLKEQLKLMQELLNAETLRADHAEEALDLASAASAEISDLASQNIGLKNKLIEAHTKFSALKEAQQESSMYVENLLQKLSEQDDLVSSLKKELTRVQKEKDDLTTALEETDAGAEGLLQDLESFRESSDRKITELSYALEEANAELQDLKGALADLKQ